LVPMVCVTVLVTTVPVGGQLTHPLKINTAAVNACILVIPFMDLF
jgi:hypothetical protein